MIAAFLIQVGEAIPSTPGELIAASSAPTKVVLVVLAVLSLVSWTLMAAKAREFKRAERAGRQFIDEFERAHTLDEAAEISRRLPPSPHRAVMQRASRFVAETTPAIAPSGERRPRLSASQVEALRLVLDSESGAVRDGLGRFVPTLATIGSVSPLIGLLGTVLGIIESFIGIATKGSGNIGAVAPGVAEALIATAAALAVAIPAVFGYNIFAHRLNRFDGELDGFGSELIALMVREGRI